MSVIGSNILAGASGQGGDYTIARSLRFRSSASAYLNRTPASNGNQKTFTISFWVKRGKLGDGQAFVGTRPDGNNAFKFSFDSNDKLNFDIYISYQSTALVSTQVFRDPSAWYHIVAAFDSTQATSSNRVKIYVNGSQITSWSTATYPSLNDSAPYNSTIVHNIGRYPYPDSYLDGYLTEFNSIDGQALTPSSFGATNASTGVWQPKKYAGTYGTNGFYLPFTNNSTTTTLGNDFSGNGNNWTTNNISLTAGSTYDSMTDVPTLTSATASNFATLNPIRPNTATISNANLNMVSNNTATKVLATIGMTSGKFYWECQYTDMSADGRVGIATADSTSNTHVGQDANSWAYQSDGQAVNNQTYINPYGASYTTSDVIGVAFDADNGTLTFYKNNTSQGTAFTGLTSGAYFPAFGDNSSGSSSSLWVNFGQRPFTYTPPTGFVALNTFNLPTPTIGATETTQANKYFDAVTYTGSGSEPRTITNTGGFYPDLVWVKARSIDYIHVVYDSVRGTGTTKSLYTQGTNAEGAFSDYTNLSAFTSSGFTVGTTSLTNVMNNSGTSFVSWQWNAGSGTAVSNTDGSITSTVSANTSAGFSVATFTAPASFGGFTVGHGLGVAPSMLIIKQTNSSSSWWVWNKNLSGSNSSALRLNSTDAVITGDTSIWNNTNPTSTVFSLTSGYFPSTSGTCVAYCFSEVAGYSKFGSYTGNDSSDGPFVYTGFKPRFLLLKNTSVTGDWVLIDAARSTYNVSANKLYPNLSNAENSTATDNSLDILSNGFKLRGDAASNDATNGPSNTIIYMAFAENPFKYSLAR